MKIILASGSPRRRELITKITKSFDVITASVDERAIEEKLIESSNYDSMIPLATEIVESLSYEKARAVFEKLGKPSDTVVIGADTTVCLKDEIMGKPLDRNDAVRMLRKQSLEPQHVITGVSFISEEKTMTFSVSTLVVFNRLDEVQEKKIQAYCDTDEPYDKAGAYGIQASGDVLVSHYEGDFNNIVGFPVDEIKKKLIEFGGIL